MFPDSLCGAVKGGSGDAIELPMEGGNASQGLQTAAALAEVRGKPWRGFRWEFWKEWEKRNSVECGGYEIPLDCFIVQ